MPLSINVGLSRKASENYQSQGVSINVTAELDQSLLTKPDELQRQVADLYAQAEKALDRQAADPGPISRQNPPLRRPPQAPRNGGGYRNGGGNTNGNNGRSRNGGMTDSQRRAINSIAQRLDIDPRTEAREIVGEFDELTVRQASELIDHLKGLAPTNGH